jgi:hypothetical protein
MKYDISNARHQKIFGAAAIRFAVAAALAKHKQVAPCFFLFNASILVTAKYQEVLLS